MSPIVRSTNSADHTTVMAKPNSALTSTISPRRRGKWPLTKSDVASPGVPGAFGAEVREADL
ncbi:hypothetical protein GCM10010393_21730 [Streptomyces gobitricini]|uniref:Uncharacterized protein n=1 Tax=Streptomyces gobitricini TaxID=68211 RepID=A0ABN3LW92_9ACTN